MFETKSTDDLARIASAGEGFELNGALRSTEDLAMIARSASNHGTRVTFSGLGSRSLDDLARIASAGKGAVIFVP